MFGRMATEDCETDRLGEGWPVKAADNVHLRIPDQKNGSTESFKLQYDGSHRYLKVVDVCGGTRTNTGGPLDTTDKSCCVYDTIDVDDMVGAALEIILNDPHDASPTIRANNNTNNNCGSSLPSNEPASDLVVDTQAKAILTIYTYPRCRPRSWFSRWRQYGRTSTIESSPQPNFHRSSTPYPRTKRIHRYTLCATEDLGHARTLVAGLRHLASGGTYTATTPPKHYLVLANPKSGSQRTAVATAKQVVIPMLEESGIDCTLCVTTHSNHAHELCRQQPSDAANTAEKITTTTNSGGGGDAATASHPRDVSHYDAIVMLGGDGIVHEVINGLASRSDQLQRPLGIVGCGTANGLAKSITVHSKEHHGVLQDAFLIAKGRTIDGDVSTYSILTSSSSSRDDKKEKDQDTIIWQHTSFLTYTWGIIADIDLESEKIHCLGDIRFDVWAVVRVLFLRTYDGKLCYTNESNPTVPSLKDPVPSHWTVAADGPIILLWASHVSHAGTSVYHSPSSRMDDGVLRILLVRADCVSRYRLARILLGLESGSHVDMPGVQWIECTAYRLEPEDPNVTFNDIDGECVEPGPVQASVIPKGVQYFGTPATITCS